MATATTTATEAVARELVNHCKAGKNLEALDHLYSPNIVSTEPRDFEGLPARMNGINAIRKKNEWWFDNYDINRQDVDGPYINGDEFALRFEFDHTNKKTGERKKDTEIAVYTVRDGKIVDERFFGMAGMNG